MNRFELYAMLFAFFITYVGVVVTIIISWPLLMLWPALFLFVLPDLPKYLSRFGIEIISSA